MKTVYRNSFILIGVLAVVIILAFILQSYLQRFTVPQQTTPLAEIGLSGNESLIHKESFSRQPHQLDEIIRANGEVVLAADTISEQYTQSGDLFLFAQHIEDTPPYEETLSMDVYEVQGNELLKIDTPDGVEATRMELRRSHDHGGLLMYLEYEQKVFVQLPGEEWQEVATDFLPEEYLVNGRTVWNKRIEWMPDPDPVIEFSYDFEDLNGSLPSQVTFLYRVTEGTIEQATYTGKDAEFSIRTHYFDSFPHFVCAAIFRSPDELYSVNDLRYSQCIGTYFDQWDIKVTTPILGRQAVKISERDENDYESVLSWPALISNRKASAQALNPEAAHMLVQVDHIVGVLNTTTGEFAHMRFQIEPSWTDMFQLRVLSTPME